MPGMGLDEFPVHNLHSKQPLSPIVLQPSQNVQANVQHYPQQVCKLMQRRITLSYVHVRSPAIGIAQAMFPLHHLTFSQFVQFVEDG
jgi:hypothetical protein